MFEAAIIFQKTKMKTTDQLDDLMTYLRFLITQFESATKPDGELGKLLKNKTAAQNETTGTHADASSVDVRKDAERKIKEVRCKTF